MLPLPIQPGDKFIDAMGLTLLLGAIDLQVQHLLLNPEAYTNQRCTGTREPTVGSPHANAVR